MTHTSTEQPAALRLAEHLEKFRSFPDDLAAAAELRRLHAESEQHLQELRSYRITVENREARIAELEAQVQDRLDRLYLALEVCSAELFAQCAHQGRAMKYVDQARSALAAEQCARAAQAKQGE